jgi:hypothetical protein
MGIGEEMERKFIHRSKEIFKKIKTKNKFNLKQNG